MNKRKLGAIATAAAVPVLLSTVMAGSASAHGSMGTPVSRVYACYLENPESPDTPACKDAVGKWDTQPLYDWDELNIGTANGKHREIIPDGQLCSAGRAKYHAYDAARTDWPSTALPTGGGAYTFRYPYTADHPGTFEIYITKDGFNPLQTLKWSDLDSTLLAKVKNPPKVNGEYRIEGRLPAKTGRHIIYSIWQRSDSAEAFYTCSDVTFGAVSTPTPTATATATATPTVTPTLTPTPTPTVSPTASPTVSPSSTPTVTTTATPPTSQPWAAGVSYTAGTLVTYGGSSYRCLQAHTSLPGWEPANVPALWQRV